jgi:hypothetical protein
MFIATVYKFQEDTYPNSHRPDGDYASFIGDTEEEAVKAAITATQRWESNSIYKDGRYKYYGPYDILVSEATKKVNRFKYKLIDLED